MTNRIITGIVFLFLSIALFSQNRANIWYFGKGAGLDFSNGEPVPLSNSSMVSEAGCAAICDNSGNLLFYTNGRKIWNSQHYVMPNGENIEGGVLLNQNSVIIPKPANEDIYYLFTVDSSGFKYSEIDLQLANGLGDVVLKNILLFENVVEKITAVNHCNSIDSWAVVHSRDTSLFLSFQISEEGINAVPVYSYCGSKILADIGYMKTSPIGDKIALPVNSSTTLTEIFDFDNSTGTISDPVKIYKEDISYAFGIEFSGNGKMLYISTGGEFYRCIQYDLTLQSQEEINNSATVIAEGNIYALQNAPDGKIYIAKINDPYLSVINNPNLNGLDCFFEPDKIYLGDRICKMGLPNFNQSYFYDPSISLENVCFGDTTIIYFDYSNNIDSVIWNLYLDTPDIIRYQSPFIIFNNYDIPGVYNVQLLVHHCDTIDTIVNQFSIYQNPIVNLGSDTVVQDVNSIILDAGSNMDEYIWSDGSTNRYLFVSDTGTYWVEVVKNTCKAHDSIHIKVKRQSVILPNAFSPNNDGVNDIFIARLADVVFDFQMAIFNRYGDRVFYSGDINQGWDGKYKGYNSPIDTYIYEISYIVPFDGKQELEKITGLIYLIR